MLRLIIIFVLAIAVGLFISKLFSNKQDDTIIDGEAIDADGKPNKPSLLPILFLGLILAGVVFFVLPRFSTSVMRLLQTTIAFFTLRRFRIFSIKESSNIDQLMRIDQLRRLLRLFERHRVDRYRC